MSTGLVFYEKSHRYKLDGQWVPGVTTLIKDGLPNKALMYWSARTVAEHVADNPEGVEALRAMGRNAMVGALKEVPWQKRDDAGERGTEVHALAERLIRGEEVEVPANIAGYVDSCCAYLDEWRPRPLVVERPIGHRAHWWAGTGDLFAELPDGTIVLDDYKTARSGIWPETAWQLNAYANGEFYVDENGDEQPLPKVQAVRAVWLREDGYEVKPLEFGPHVYKEFRHMCMVAAAAKRGKGSKTAPGYVGESINPPAWKDEPAA